MLNDFINSFATLFVTIDPIGNVPIFMALISAYPVAVQRAITLRACLVSLIILLVFAFIGSPLLAFLGISLPALQITGGLLLLLVAFDMVFERRSERREKRVEETEPELNDWQSLAIFPLAIPMLAGAGAMTSLLVATAGNPVFSGGFVLSVLALILVIGLFIALMLATIALGNKVNKQVYLVLTRVMGVILAALSTQFIISGIKAAFAL